MLDERHGEHVMAVSTAGQILARLGLVTKRRPRHRSPGRIEHSPYEVAGAGDSMTADYKGQFRMGNGALCYPLTVADPFSRYVLAIDAMASTHMAAGQGRLREGLSRVWSAAADDHRQRHSVLRRRLAGRADAALALVDRARDRSDPNQARPPGSERDSRADASNAQGLDPAEQAEELARSAAKLQCLPDRVQRRASASEPGTEAALDGLSARTGLSAQVHARSNTTRNMDVRRVNANGEIKWKGQPIFLSEVLIGANVGLLRDRRVALVDQLQFRSHRLSR